MTASRYLLTVTKADKRYKSGVRHCNSYEYTFSDRFKDKWMEEEVRDLRSKLYREEDGYTLTVSRTT